MEQPDPWHGSLQALHRAGVHYVAVGSWALRKYLPAWNYAPPDSDLVVENTAENLKTLWQVLGFMDWKISVWEEAVPAFPGMERLTGKYYLRARRNGAILDITYEPAIPWEEMAAGSILRDGIWLAAPLPILRLKALRNRPGDAETVAALAQILGISPQDCGITPPKS